MFFVGVTFSSVFEAPGIFDFSKLFLVSGSKWVEPSISGRTCFCFQFLDVFFWFEVAKRVEPSISPRTVFGFFDLSRFFWFGISNCLGAKAQGPGRTLLFQ